MISFIAPQHMEACSEKLRPCAEALNLQFRDLRYSIPAKGGKLKEVLHDVSGQVLSGRLTAILGPSGAGKTSLLNVLAGFKTKGVTGSMFVNGVTRNYEEFRTQTCYITQDLSMLSQLTAHETLTVAAKLKLVSSNEERSFVVSEILELLGLTKCKNTYVQNLSGGEKKRLSIGVELITNPPLMFVDEPTSGVDSVSSAQIMSHLKRLASAGRTVVCVIHQPSSKLCEMFDDVILLAEGQILYCGPTNQILHVFQEAGFPCPSHYNRADFMLEVACGERGTDLSKLYNKFRFLPPEVFDTLDEGLLRLNSNDSEEAKLNEEKLAVVIENSDHNTIGQTYKNKKGRYPIGGFSQFIILLQRTFMCTYRDLYMAQIRVICHVVVGLLLGIMFYDVGNDAAKIESNAACLFFFALFLFFSNAMPTIVTFPSETSVFLREHLNNWYSVSTYFFAKCLANFPLQLLCPTVFLLSGYWLTGQPSEVTRFSKTLLLCVLLVILGQGLGMMIGAACDSSMGMFLVPVTTIPMLLFSGFFQRLQDIPIYIQWLGQISYFRNVFEGLVTTMYSFNRQRLPCSEPFCFYRNGDKFVKHLGMSEENFWYDVCGLIAWILFLHLVLFIVLKWRIRMAK